MRLYNTLSKDIEEFKPGNPKKVSLYACGPTVYDYTHIGHLRTYINNDLLKRVLIHLGYAVSHVMNITDVGHLTGDDDRGEDKIEKGAIKKGKTVWEVAEFYTDYFEKAIKAVNVTKPNYLVKATDHIKEMISLIQILEKKGYTYTTKEAIYFDVTKHTTYGQLSGQKLAEKKTGSREDVHVDDNKKHPADFALWFFCSGRFAHHTMRWESPWGTGFPGWHIECSAMSMKYLGNTIDIHAGGIDHIPVHHENEIAQSEAATGKQFVRYWFHNSHLLVKGEKMSKSLGNFITLDDVVKKRTDPLALRYLFFQTHYRQIQNFTWEALAAAQSAYNKLKETAYELKTHTGRAVFFEEKLAKHNEYRIQFEQAIADDLQIPRALAIVWDMLKSNIPSPDKYDLLLSFDEVLGLQLAQAELEVIPDEILEFLKKRDALKKQSDFAGADRLRVEIERSGYEIRDTPTGSYARRKTNPY